MKHVSFKSLNANSYYQRLHLEETKTLFDTSTKMITTYTNNSLFLWLDFSVGMLSLMEDSGLSYAEYMVMNLETELSHLFTPMKSSSPIIESSSSFQFQQEIESFLLTVMLFDETECENVLFYEMVNKENVHAIVDQIKQAVKAKATDYKAHIPRKGGDAILERIVQQTCFYMNFGTPFPSNSILVMTNGAIPVTS